MTDPGVVRVMTWNIHGALGRNPRFDLSRVVALIQRHEPDVVALQEIDSRRPRDAGVDNPFVVLAQALGGHAIGAKSIVTKDGDYGQALLSRTSITEETITDLSQPGCEPRRAILAVVDTPAGRLRVIATHLGLGLSERRCQTDQLVDLIGAGDAPTVALGDFNDWFWPKSVRASLAGLLPARSRVATFPSRVPVLRLDRIYCRPATMLARCFTDPEAAAISDHLPVIADLRLRS